jgi:hypothetical protein
MVNFKFAKFHCYQQTSIAIYCREQKILVVNVISKFG